MPHNRFKESWWLRGGHAQTLWPALVRRVPLHVRSERLELPDGDVVRLDWVGTNGPIFVSRLSSLSLLKEKTWYS